MQAEIEAVYEAVLDGEEQEAATATEAALLAGRSPVEILNEGMIAAMAEVGRLFETGEFFVPEMLIAARAMQAGLTVLKPQLIKADIKSAGRIVLGTVKGDLHDIGKNLVGMMLEGAGFEVIDLGINVPPDRFIEAIRAHQPQILGMSALLTTTIPNMRVTIDAIQAAGLRATVKIVVGGAPVTEAFAQKIGADGYAADASRAVTLAKTLVA
ncbi:MAG: corrinoid protein [Anaerolineales bacterium]|nr:corrinoid protein [Anaerolineales bacterium]